MARILLLNFGSLGDLHPFIGMAIALQKAGHEVSLASNPIYLPRIEAAGIKAHGVGPKLSPDDPELIKAVMSPLRGPELLHKKYIFPHSEQSIEETLPLARNSDLLITGILGYFVPTLSELTQVPWAMAMLAPMGYWSAHDPAALPAIPFLRSFKFMGPRFYKQLYKLLFLPSKSWSAPLQEARKKHGLAPQANPMAPATLNSCALNLALFSKHFAPPQADWPKNLKQVGFIEYDGEEAKAPLNENIEKFLANGEAPILLTLGSTNVLDPGKIYETFHEAVHPLNKRTLISVATKDLAYYQAKFSNNNTLVTDYIPYGKVMPKSSFVVHQGGIGTTAQCLRAGKASIILASVNDQVDNARHVEKIGAGLYLAKKKLNAASLRKAILKVEKSTLQTNAQKIGEKIKSENSCEKLVSAVKDLLANKD
ncbi:MAG: glycosyltransferase [Bdellovibrionota bacterium]